MDKTVTQHAGNLGFALTTALSSLGPLLTSPRFAREIPGLNLGVAVVETANALHQYSHGEQVVAMGHLGNAAGCFGAFAEDVGRFVSLAGSGGHPLLGSAAVGLGVAGGLLGIAQGNAEIKSGLALRKASGSTRTLHMGIADSISGLTTVAGIVLRAGGLAPALGTSLLVAASVCDLASIAVDYAGMLADRRDQQEPPNTPPAA